MATLFLVIIYLSFISLGLPDSLLGVAWPVMQLDIKAPFEAAGLVSMTMAGSTIISSIASGTVIQRLGTGKVVFISCLMTASSLLGFSFSPSLVWLIFLAVPLGLGAGSVDSALNNYVATHYKARHMSWRYHWTYNYVPIHFKRKFLEKRIYDCFNYPVCVDADTVFHFTFMETCRKRY